MSAVGNIDGDLEPVGYGWRPSRALIPGAIMSVCSEPGRPTRRGVALN